MSHQQTTTGRPVVECDDPIADPDGRIRRCGRRSTGRRDRFGSGSELDVWDLPRGWAVAPYPDGYDHGATRTSLLDGSPIPPIPALVDVTGDLHTCPSCARRSERAA